MTDWRVSVNQVERGIEATLIYAHWRARYTPSWRTAVMRLNRALINLHTGRPMANGCQVSNRALRQPECDEVIHRAISKYGISAVLLSLQR